MSKNAHEKSTGYQYFDHYRYCQGEQIFASFRGSEGMNLKPRLLCSTQSTLLRLNAVAKANSWQLLVAMCFVGLVFVPVTALSCSQAGVHVCSLDGDRSVRF